MSTMNKIIEKLLTHSKRKNTKVTLVGIVCLFCVLGNITFLEEDQVDSYYLTEDGIDPFWMENEVDSWSRLLTVEENPSSSQHHPYETLIPPEQVDFSIDERLSWPDAESSCNDILLYMPYEHSINGQGAQLNAYVKATLLSTFLNKALVILEADKFHTLPEWYRHMPAKTLYDGKSQFGCPADAFDGDNIKSDFPQGLSRLIQHPRWVGRGCPVPTCGGTKQYRHWEAERLHQKSFIRGNSRPRVVDCVEGDRHIKVTALGSSSLVQMFKPGTGITQKMIDRSQGGKVAAYQWALRLGASEEEAQAFTEISAPNLIWDFLAALVNRSGVLRFQPWVARDVQERIESMNLPLNGSYDAFHVRRGDKLIREARAEVRNYWKKKGRGRRRTNYIPFTHYVEKAWGTCKANHKVQKRNLKKLPAKTVYIATDDPATVHREVNSMKRVNGRGASIIDGCGHKVNFVFPPSSTNGAFHINDRRAGDDCKEAYKRNIAAVADLVVLARANKFVGDYNSNWGRFIKIARSFIKTDDDTTQPLARTKSMIAAFGPSHPGIPGS